MNTTGVASSTEDIEPDANATAGGNVTRMSEAWEPIGEFWADRLDTIILQPPHILHDNTLDLGKTKADGVDVWIGW